MGRQVAEGVLRTLSGSAIRHRCYSTPFVRLVVICSTWPLRTRPTVRSPALPHGTMRPELPSLTLASTGFGGGTAGLAGRGGRRGRAREARAVRLPLLQGSRGPVRRLPRPSPQLHHAGDPDRCKLQDSPGSRQALDPDADGSLLPRIQGRRTRGGELSSESCPCQVPDRLGAMLGVKGCWARHSCAVLCSEPGSERWGAGWPFSTAKRRNGRCG